MIPAKTDAPNIEIYRFGEFELSPARRLLERDGMSIHLSARLLDALILLVTNYGKVVIKEVPKTTLGPIVLWKRTI
jgi:DNA-binding response OmpR family regulator